MLCCRRVLSGKQPEQLECALLHRQLAVVGDSLLALLQVLPERPVEVVEVCKAFVVAVVAHLVQTDQQRAPVNVLVQRVAHSVVQRRARQLRFLVRNQENRVPAARVLREDGKVRALQSVRVHAPERLPRLRPRERRSAGGADVDDALLRGSARSAALPNLPPWWTATAFKSTMSLQMEARRGGLSPHLSQIPDGMIVRGTREQLLAFH